MVGKGEGIRCFFLFVFFTNYLLSRGVFIFIYLFIFRDKSIRLREASLAYLLYSLESICSKSHKAGQHHTKVLHTMTVSITWSCVAIMITHCEFSILWKNAPNIELFQENRRGMRRKRETQNFIIMKLFMYQMYQSIMICIRAHYVSELPFSACSLQCQRWCGNKACLHRKAV